MRRQKGFGIVAAIFVLVMLAAIAAMIAAIGNAQQVSSTQDILFAKAGQAARAGSEWGLHRALKGPWKTSCTPAAPQAQTLDLLADTGFYVAVTCQAYSFNEGESTIGSPKSVTFFDIRAVACSDAICPSADPARTAGPGYVERARVVLAERPE